MKMRTLFTAAFCALLCTAATASAPKLPPPPLPKKVHPGIWKFADADTTIYLFGTIHVLPKNYFWRTAKFNQIAASADTLVLEVNDLDDQAKSAQTFIKLAVSPGLPPVSDRVPAKLRPELAKVIANAGIASTTLDQFESWAVAITLAAGMLKDLDVSPDNGVERLLTAQFRAAKKPVEGLETSEWQLGLFDRLSEPAQQSFLIGMIDVKEDPATEYSRMLGAWSRGNDKAIALSFDDELKLSPELSNVLLHQRNSNWAELLQKRLEKPGIVLVAVGAGHLAGPDSVQTLLAKRGLKVTRVQ